MTSSQIKNLSSEPPIPLLKARLRSCARAFLRKRHHLFVQGECRYTGDVTVVILLS